jgi:hypothetical protein
MSFNLSSAPFSSTSLWNQQVNTGATYTPINWPSSTSEYYAATWASTGFPVYVASSSDPVVQVSVPASWGWPGGTVSVHVPAGATGAPAPGVTNPDSPIIVIDGDTVYNFWQFNRTSDTTATAQAYGEANVVTGTGWGSPGLGAGVGAAGNSELGGLLVQAQTDTGAINHALEIAVDNNLLAPGFVAPAIGGDGYTVGAPLQEGQLLAIPPGTPMPSGLSPLGQEVFRALQQYGAYITERAGAGATVLRAQQNAYNATTISALNTDLNKVLPLLGAVSGGSPTSSGSTSSSGTTSGGTTATPAPTVAITSAGGTVTSASQTIVGTVDAADAGSTVKVLDGTTQIGSATVGANGAWSANVTLPNQGTNVITATDANAGGTGTSSAVTYTFHSVAPTVAITSAGGTVTSASQTIAGTVDAADAASTVNVLDGTTQIGSATVGANGAWSANVTLPNQGANVITATDANAAGTGTSSAVTYDYEPPAPPTTPVAPTLTVANQSLHVSPGGSVSLGLGVSVPNAGDNVSVNISGLPKYETITDKLDGKTFSGSSVTLTAAEVNSGLSLSSSYRGHGHPTATLTVTATDNTGTPMTSTAQSITVVDPPATTTSSSTTGITTGTRSGSTGAETQSRTPSTPLAGRWPDQSANHQQLGVTQWLDRHPNFAHNVTQWFDRHPDFAPAVGTLSEAGASRSDVVSAPATTTTTDPTAGVGAKAYALLNQMMAGDFGRESHFAQAATALSASSQPQANLLTRPLH